MADMKTTEEAAREAERLLAIRPRLVAERPQSILGVDNVAILDAELGVLREFAQGGEPRAIYDPAGFQSYDWLCGNDDYSPSEGWADLLGPEE